MKPLHPSESLPFLEPPHHHDVSQISLLASIPTSLLFHLPASHHDHLWALQESTSVIYASHSRLQHLISQRFERLTPLSTDQTSFNEAAFFTYQSQLTNERTYLLTECLPDFKHKRLSINLEPYNHLAITHHSQKITIKAWMDQIESAALSWAEEARCVQIPEFEETVREYLRGQQGE